MNRMDAVQLIHMQLAIERIGLNRDRLLVCVPGPDPDEMARVYVYQHEAGYLLFVRWDVPVPIREQIRSLGAESAFQDGAAVRELLATDALCTDVDMFYTYVFPDAGSLEQYPDVVRLGEPHRELIEAYHLRMDVVGRAVYGVIRDGGIVATCGSARENEAAGECSVFTRPAYRRRGYGRQVTGAWGHQLREEGKVAFYSHTAENTASRSVARSLGLRPCFSLVTYS